MAAPIALEPPKTLSAEESALRKSFTERFKLHPVLSQILIIRGLREEDEVERFLFGDLTHLPNPFDLSGMSEAVERVIEALRKKEPILLFGDYDVDGMTGCSQLALFLKEVGSDVRVFLPHRLHDGYGLTASSLEKIKAAHPGLVITIDNGTKSKEAISVLKDEGIDTIVIDHHETPDAGHLPPVVALINPKSPGQKFTERNLASAGLVFLFLVALRSRLRETTASLPNLKRYLDLACLGTIADVVPLTGTNRLIVKYGLAELTQSQRPGIKALKQVAGVLDEVTPYVVGFRLAPRLNAAGRMADPQEALTLLMAVSETEAIARAQALETYNRQRQMEEEKALKEAYAMIDAKDSPYADHRGIVVGSKDWPLGIVGILAARLTEKYHRPSIALSFFEDKGIAKGSARSVPGFSVHKALKAIESTMLNFGGHDAAAGMTIDLNSVKTFSESFSNSVARLAPEPFQKKIRVDANLSFTDISPLLMEQLSWLGPYGAGHPEPVFLTEGVQALACRVIGNEDKHLKFSALHSQTSLEAVFFDGAREMERLIKNPRQNIIYYLQKNIWNGKTTIQLKLKHLL